MFVYLDESGCAGMKLDRGSSPTFTLAAVVFPDAGSTRVCRQQLADLKVEMGWPKTAEFKFNKTSKSNKDRFFQAARGWEFVAHSFTLNKRKLYVGSLSNPKDLYSRVVSWTLENLVERMNRADAPDLCTLMFDACGDRDFYDFLEQFAGRRMAASLGDRRRVRVVAEDSKRENLLQLADMVCGAVAQKHRQLDRASASFDTIRPKLGSCRLWPQ